VYQDLTCPVDINQDFKARNMLFMLLRLLDRDAIAGGFMQPSVDSAFVGFPVASSKRSRIPWLIVVVGCAYFLWLAVGFTRTIPTFTKLYVGLGVELPLPTRILLSSHLWFLPIVFTLAAMLTVAKKLVEFSRRQLRVVNLTLIVIGAIFPALLVWSLYLPLFALIGKLAWAH
jgi:hypothetical protein